jgi:hypothetical protein
MQCFLVPLAVYECTGLLEKYWFIWTRTLSQFIFHKMSNDKLERKLYFWNNWGTQNALDFLTEEIIWEPWNFEQEYSPLDRLFPCQCNYWDPQLYHALFTKSRNSGCCLMHSCGFLFIIRPGCQGRKCLRSCILIFITETNLLFLELMNSRDGTVLTNTNYSSLVFIYVHIILKKLVYNS